MLRGSRAQCVQCAMTNENEQRGTRVERELSQSTHSQCVCPDPRISTRRAARISHIAACAEKTCGSWRSGPRATTRQSGSGACKRAAGAAAHAPLGLVVVWPLGPAWTLVREGGPPRMRQAASFGARAAGRRRTRGVFCQPCSAGRAACPSCTASCAASSAGEGCWRRRGLAALYHTIPKGRPSRSASDVLRRWAVKRRGGAFTRQAWARGRCRTTRSR